MFILMSFIKNMIIMLIFMSKKMKMKIMLKFKIILLTFLF